MTEDWEEKKGGVCTFNRRCVWYRIIPSQLITPRLFCSVPETLHRYSKPACCRLSTTQKEEWAEAKTGTKPYRCTVAVLVMSSRSRSKSPPCFSFCPILPAAPDSHLTTMTGRGNCQPKHLALVQVSKPLPQRLVGNNGSVFPLLATPSRGRGA